MKKIRFEISRTVYVDDSAEMGDIDEAVLSKMESMVDAVRNDGFDISCVADIDIKEGVELKCPFCGGTLRPRNIAIYGLMCSDCDREFFDYDFY